jgi:N-acetylglucosamine-6-phosphate deacetylase
MDTISLVGARIFDGGKFCDDNAVVIRGNRIIAIGRPEGMEVLLDGGVLAPGFVDLQVNGAGGIQVGKGITVEGIRRICATQARLGATSCLPTLITDSPEVTSKVIKAGIETARAKVPGFLGLHLEGPHLDPRRKGAHDAGLIRPMTEADLALLLRAAAELPFLMVTLAPEAVTTVQISALADAGVLVSLGHSDCSAAAAADAFAAGANCVTHLFNAMSQLGNREPGLVGAALASNAFCGLIADGIHVDPITMRVALEARKEKVFLVSDCMSLAGTDGMEMQLGSRRILRKDGRLALEDGTLAGADLTLAQAVATLVRKVGIAPERALAMSSAVPAEALRMKGSIGCLAPDRVADIVYVRDDWTLGSTWQGGVNVRRG